KQTLMGRCGIPFLCLTELTIFCALPFGASDGVITFHEFKTWYQTPAGSGAVKNAHAALVKDITLSEAKNLTTLATTPLSAVVDAMIGSTSSATKMTKNAFASKFERFIKPAARQTPQARQLIDRLFAVFDGNMDGVIDVTELCSGLSVLCAGDRDNKVRAAFDLFDKNGDGYITLDEMKTYLNSVFRILYNFQPDLEDSVGASVTELATATAEQCFEEADLNQDSRLSFEEFRRWYNAGGGGTTQSLLSNATEFATIQEARDIMGLSSHSPKEVFQLLKSCGPSGVLTRRSFLQGFRLLSEATNGRLDSNQKSRLTMITNRLFDVFDSDGNGVIDASELAAGLSVLCGGSREDKVKAAFDLYDIVSPSDCVHRRWLLTKAFCANRRMAMVLLPELKCCPT
ncbi:Frq1, partial [Symbiodinium sp. KB8]